MTPDLWRQYCRNLNNLGYRIPHYPWDPLMQLPRILDVSCTSSSGSGAGCLGVILCQRTVANPLAVGAWVTITGGVDDDLAINGQIIEPGLHTGGAACNQPHAIDYTFWLPAGGSFTIGAADNFGGPCYLAATATFSPTPPAP